MVGGTAACNANLLHIGYPIEKGIVCNWDDMELLWNYAFLEQLKVDPKGCKILLSESPMNSHDKRKRMAEMMFEKYGFEGAYFANSGVLPLYASGMVL